MSKRCSITNVKPMVGNNVSHAVNKTKRKFLPNLQNTSFFSEILGKKIRLKVSSKGIKTVEKKMRIHLGLEGLKLEFYFFPFQPGSFAETLLPVLLPYIA